MSLAAGTRLGPYEIQAPLGAGGMGEVYRAHDPRLGRDVAIKVLPTVLSTDAERLHRFEQEARAAAALNHPNILAVYDIGQHGGSPYIVSELLEGETLRERLKRGALPARKVVEHAVQIAHGLAAAHEKGITHRDLKPENLFVTTDGRVKILDFGLAKLTQVEPAAAGASALPTMARDTQPGLVLGTVGYMSPEQVRAAPVDHRSDVFSFGCVLYEALTGRRAFQRGTMADTMAAILREEPEPPATLQPQVSPALERVIVHCLEKSPGERFQSMSDVAFNLRTLSSMSSGPEAAPGVTRRLLTRKRLMTGAGLVAAALSGFALAGVLSRTEAPRFRKLTFQRGTIYSARFAPDGRTVVYGAAWGGGGIQLYSARTDARESRPFGIAADVLGISPSGEMALSLGRKPVMSLLSAGRLARAPLAGGAPREVLDGIVDADWSQDGRDLAVTREIGGEARLEYPIGRVLHTSGGYLSSPRVSPRGDAVAFIEHPVKGDDRGTVALAVLSGAVQTLVADMPSVTGLAWSPDGREIWFTAWIADEGYSIQAVTPQGKRRTVARPGVRVKLFDILGQRLLVGYESGRAEISGLLAGDTRERDLSWLDGSGVTDISPAGDQLLFIEGWEGGGANYSFFLRKPDSPYPVRLGEGMGSDLSADGRWVLGYPPQPPGRLMIVPTGTGEAKTIELPGLEAVGGANWFPDGKRVLLWANETGQAFRGWVVDLEGGRTRPITPPGVAAPLFASGTNALAPDGQLVVAADPDGKLLLYPVDGGDPRAVPGVLPGEEPVRWASEGRAMFVRRRAELPNRVYRVDLRTGQRELWKALMPGDPAGVIEGLGVVPTPDGRFYAYSYLRVLTELYLIEGLK